MKKILFILLAVAVPFAASAQKKGKTRRKAPAIEAAEIVPALSVKPVEGKDFSYAVGVLQAGYFKNMLMQEGVDTAYMAKVVEGFRAGLGKQQTDEAIAYAAGLKMARMMDGSATTFFNEKATGKADTTYFDLDTFRNAIAATLTKQNAIQADSAQKIFAQQETYTKEMAIHEGRTWLALNKLKQGVVTTASGLQYRVLTEGKGAVPADTATVEVNYEGKLINGKVFDSSYKRGEPLKIPVNGVIKGWQEALKMMPEGSVWELYIPYELGYGERGAGQDIPPYATLIFKVEMLKANAGK